MSQNGDSGRGQITHKRFWAKAAWIAAIVLIAVHAWRIVDSIEVKSATFDEMFHITAGYSQLKFSDFRLAPEAGTLSDRLAALGLMGGDYKFPSQNEKAWKRGAQWRVSDLFFNELGNDPIQMLFYARIPIVIVSTLLGLLVFAMSKRIFGDGAGLLSLVLYSFSPTVLAHGGLATADLTAAFFFLAAAGSLFGVMKKVSLFRLALSSLAVAGLLLSKMSGILILPMAVLMAGAILASRRPMIIAFGDRKRLKDFKSKLLTLTGIGVVHVATVMFLIWAAYGFRFGAVSESDDEGHLSRNWEEVLSRDGPMEMGVRFAKEHELLPEAWLIGLAYTLKTTETRRAFMNGEYSETGWLSFFVYCFAVKTPTSVLAILALAATAALFRWRRRRDRALGFRIDDRLFETTPLWCLILVAGGAAVFSNLNIGHRHIIPLYPPLFILAGSVVRQIRSALEASCAALASVFLALLIGVSFSIRPDYLSYFNELAGGSKNGYKHIVDSSLDWGQDLPALKRWLDANAAGEPNVYLSYFGTSRAETYGIKARLLPGFSNRPHPFEKLKGGIYCISATMYQGVYTEPFGPWTQGHEAKYREVMAAIAPFLEGDSKLVDKLGDSHKKKLDELVEVFKQMRLARLCAWLRSAKREPDGMAGHSILIFRLTDEEIRAAVGGDY